MVQISAVEFAVLGISNHQDKQQPTACGVDNPHSMCSVCSSDTKPHRPPNDTDTQGLAGLYYRRDAVVFEAGFSDISPILMPAQVVVATSPLILLRTSRASMFDNSISHYHDDIEVLRICNLSRATGSKSGNSTQQVLQCTMETLLVCDNQEQEASNQADYHIYRHLFSPLSTLHPPKQHSSYTLKRRVNSSASIPKCLR
jgi:hypothetical protein